MTQSQKTISSLLLVILAGAWGYAGNSFISRAESWFDNVTTSEPTTSSHEEAADEATQKLVPDKTEERQATTIPTFPKPIAAPAYRQAAPTAPEFTPPANPYAAMNRTMNGQGNLQNTLESITPGEARPRSNAYFDKLSQQLRELQGENPPQPGTPQDTEEPNVGSTTEEAQPERTIEEANDNTDYGTETTDQLEEVLQDDDLADELEQILDEEGY